MTTTNKTRIIVVGGGTGGMAVIAALNQWPGRDRIDITLLEPSDYHYYQPQWTMVGGGLFPREVTRRPMADLIPVIASAPDETFLERFNGRRQDKDTDRIEI